jgi:hypothetical protein
MPGTHRVPVVDLDTRSHTQEQSSIHTNLTLSTHSRTIHTAINIGACIDTIQSQPVIPKGASEGQKMPFQTPTWIDDIALLRAAHPYGPSGGARNAGVKAVPTRPFISKYSATGWTCLDTSLRNMPDCQRIRTRWEQTSKLRIDCMRSCVTYKGREFRRSS